MCALRRRSQRRPLLGRSSTTERNHVCSAVYDALRVVRVVGVGAGTERNHVCSAVYEPVLSATMCALPCMTRFGRRGWWG